MVVAGVGVEHQKLVDIVQKYFVDIKPIWEVHDLVSPINKKISLDNSIAQYTGGIIQVYLFQSFK